MVSTWYPRPPPPHTHTLVHRPRWESLPGAADQPRLRRLLYLLPFFPTFPILLSPPCLLHFPCVSHSSSHSQVTGPEGASCACSAFLCKEEGA